MGMVIVEAIVEVGVQAIEGPWHHPRSKAIVEVGFGPWHHPRSKAIVEVGFGPWHRG